MDYLTLFVFLYWLIRGTDLAIGVLFRLSRLNKELPNNFAASPNSKISLIFAARDEELHIREAVEMMLAQDYPDFEVIAVNDRSRDATGEILKRFKNSRLKTIHITELPNGWLGKTHALYKGYQVSSGDWLLFTDADVKFHPQTLRHAIQAAESKKLDHLSLFPKIIFGSYLEIVFVSYFSMIFNMRFRPWAAKSSRSKAFVGIGAFNLVRRQAYEKMGTHQSVALDIADDMMLGKKIKQAGLRQMGMYGDPDVSVRWVHGAKGVWNSLHKNAFRGFNYNYFFLCLATAGMAAVDILPFAGLIFFHGQAFMLCAATVSLIGLTYLAGSRYLPAAILAFPAHLFASLLFICIFWRSAMSSLFQGGISWRGTRYPIQKLREGSTKL